MTVTADRPLVLVGGGKMGCALLGGWLADGLDGAAVMVIDPSPPNDLARTIADAPVSVHSAPPAGLTPSVLLLAIKPQMMAAVLPTLAPLVAPDTLSISIAAGTPIATLEAGLGGGAIVRVMPNTPALVGRGVNVCVGNLKVGETQRAVVDRLMAAVGSVSWIDDEALMDAVTGVSGSGPAYIFLLAECLAQAGIDAGLPADLAEKIARETVTGAGELLHRSPEKAETLRKNVMSPGGTTVAALEVLMAEDGLQPLLTKAVAAATRRSKELAG